LVCVRFAFSLKVQGTGVAQNLTMARYLFRYAAYLEHPRASARASVLEQFAVLNQSTVLSKSK
jgi:hypothetical protein